MGKPKSAEALRVINTRYGFTWGDTEIMRATEIDHNIVLHVTSATQRLVVRVTPRGVIRVEKHETKDGKPLRGRHAAD